jgi:uncharacterized protein (TIGR03437 family)
MRAYFKTAVSVLAGWLSISGATAMALPYIYGRGVRNGASFMPNSLVGGGIAQGSIFSIFGTGLGPQPGVQVSAFPVQASLAGVSVTVIQGNDRLTALPIYVSATQINAIMPSSTKPGRVAVMVSYNNQQSNPSPITVVASAFGIFSANSGGFGPGILTNFVTSANQPINALSISASVGQTVTIWGTGLGAVAADNIAPTAGNLATQTEVFVGGVSATVTYHGRSPCCAGLDQVVFTVPPNVPTGCYVPVVVRMSGTVVSNAVTMAIASASGAACSYPSNVIEQSMVAGKSVGLVMPHRVDGDVGVIVPTPFEAAGDYLLTILLQPTASPYFFFPLVSLPPQSACTVYSVDGNLASGGTLPGLLSAGRFLDGGTPSVAGAGTITAQSPFYDALLGGNNSAIFSDPTVFNPPNPVTVSMPGGADVGAFHVSVPTASTFQWTNRDSIGPTLNHTQPLTVTWTASGLSNATILIGGGNFDTPHNASNLFLCTANASAGTFTVPAWAMANVPATPVSETQPYGNVFVAAPLSAPVSFSASGLDAGFALFGKQFLKSVVWQ